MNEQQFHEALGKAIAFTNERRKDLLTGALEGGSNYWYYIGDQASNAIHKYEKEGEDNTFVGMMWRALEAGKTLPIHDAEPDGDRHKIIGRISLQSIMEGEVLMAQKYPVHFAEVKSESDDASDADIWFQLAVLKEVVYA